MEREENDKICFVSRAYDSNAESEREMQIKTEFQCMFSKSRACNHTTKTTATTEYYVT